MTKKTQLEIVFDIVKMGQPIKTEQVNKHGLANYICSADRLLRKLAEAGRICSYKLTGDKTKTWVIEKKPVQLTLGVK